jgi:hypothetical protein
VFGVVLCEPALDRFVCVCGDVVDSGWDRTFGLMVLQTFLAVD